jgi:hypothetical protein
VANLHNIGGYIVELSRNRTEWESQIEALKRDRFIDLGTRALAFTFNLYNGNDFGIIPEPNSATDDDELIFVQAVLQREASGHIERHTRITPMRPMRRFFWSGFDNPDDRTFMWWVFVGCLLYLLELRKMLLDDGFSGYFFHSQDSTWNKFDWVGVTFSGSADCQI